MYNCQVECNEVINCILEQGNDYPSKEGNKLEKMNDWCYNSHIVRKMTKEIKNGQNL